jgi:hypothetical protein
MGREYTRSAEIWEVGRCRILFRQVGIKKDVERRAWRGMLPRAGRRSSRLRCADFLWQEGSRPARSGLDIEAGDVENFSP